ncbi:hypothetical protein B0H10DRAFT_2128024 [Mycena sp. CBHHK59/15]|nr:hypothetical protein B0H10DRAFT_2128024 [Mycena sp. CBHHK59/15]
MIRTGRRSQDINAVLTHAVHFVGLLTWYLGVKLPFNVRWEGGKLGVGVPWIGPARSGWGRWTAHHPLHLLLCPAPPAASPLPAAAVAAPSLSASLSTPQSQPPEPTPAEESPQFTTALAMLLYNVLYLAHTQGLEIPLAQAGDVLSNLWAVCCAPELGRRSHATSAHPLPPPSPGALLQLDFERGGGRCTVARTFSAAFTASSPPKVSPTASMSTVKGGEGGTRDRDKRERERDRGREKEEEEGWDLVSEDGY